MRSPTFMRGSSEPTESWKTICMWRRISFMSLLPSPTSSTPSKVTSPAVGSRSRRRVRPSVDLPQPDSPTRPSVSPRRTSRSTPSTACRYPDVRFRNPCLTGKCFFSPRTLSSTSLPPSGGSGATSGVTVPELTRAPPGLERRGRRSRRASTRLPAHPRHGVAAARSCSDRTRSRNGGQNDTPGASRAGSAPCPGSP